MYFDSHCHLDRIDLADHSNSFAQLLENIRLQQVTRMICIGVSLESFDEMYAKIEPYEHIYCSAGVHPDYQHVKEPTVDNLCDRAKNEKVVAIGETGLDYMSSKDKIDWQRTRFSIHIEAAKRCKLPLIIHSRNAKQDTLAHIARAKC